MKELKSKSEVIILDNNELSIAKYAEEFPENFKAMTAMLPPKSNFLTASKKICKSCKSEVKALAYVTNGKVNRLLCDEFEDDNGK